VVKVLSVTLIAQQCLFALYFQTLPLGKLQILHRLAPLRALCEIEEQHILAAECVLHFGHVDSWMPRHCRFAQELLADDSKHLPEK
jgi:hypothetical protein